jgi:hypothetical protein
MGEWWSLAGVIEFRVDYLAMTNRPAGVVLSRSVFLVVRPEIPAPGGQRSYRWRMAQMSLQAEDPPHHLRPPRARMEPTDVTSWLWPGAGPQPDDAQWVNLDHFGATVGNPRASHFGEMVRDMLDPVWYEPVWGQLANGITVPIGTFTPEVLREHVQFTEVGTFFCSPGVEGVRVNYNPQLEIVESVVSMKGSDEIAWLRVDSVHRLA